MNTLNFETLNIGFNQTFLPNQLTLGVIAPLENYGMATLPTMQDTVENIQLAERLGFNAAWLRDVPFHVPSFGDAGHLFDPFVYLGLLAGQTERIALGVASLVLPLRHPAHIAKAMASVDVLSGGRILVGVASGDRPEEYPSMNQDFLNREQAFRDSFDYIHALAKSFPSIENDYGQLDGRVDMVPKPTAGKLPLLVTGSSRQSPEWLAANGEGWITYPRPIHIQAQIIDKWRGNIRALGGQDKPAVQSLYIDLIEDASAPPQPIHLGFRSGSAYLVEHLQALQSIGINHVALNLRFNQADIDSTLHRLAEEVLPHLNGSA